MSARAIVVVTKAVIVSTQGGAVSQAEIVDGLKADCPGYTAMRELMLSFRSMMRKPKVERVGSRAKKTNTLHRWIERARGTGIPLIQGFACRLGADILAVEGAVTEKWSNGQVEGQVNRLKTLKRQMYGRASVELLRTRLMPLAEPSILQRK